MRPATTPCLVPLAVFRMPLWRAPGAARFRGAGHDRAAARPRL